MFGTIFSWFARRELTGPQAAFLKSEDYDSLWNISFRWCNRTLDSADPANLPDEVKQLTYRLIQGFYKGDIKIYRHNGRTVPREAMPFLIKDTNPWRNVLWRCLVKSDFDYAYLLALYLERNNILSWCENTGVAPPPFWAKNAPKDALSRKLPLENRSKDEISDKLVCQAIAKVYWEIDPNIHPAHLASSHAIKRYGNGKLYTDENTVKNWINDVDPRKGQRKTGRPEKIPYRIDLETGRLEE